MSLSGKHKFRATAQDGDRGSLSMQSSIRQGPVLVDLALQGGGAHGAFTWGVLDRLLEEPSLQIEGISGTSAGAMNAAVLAQGLSAGGVQGAKTALERFWRRVSDAAAPPATGSAGTSSSVEEATTRIDSTSTARPSGA